MQRNLTDAPWRKSTFSGDSGCIEVAPLGDGVIALRDSKDPNAGTLYFTPTEMDAWIKGAKSGEFDDLAH